MARGRPRAADNTWPNGTGKSTNRRLPTESGLACLSRAGKSTEQCLTPDVAGEDGGSAERGPGLLARDVDEAVPSFAE